MTVQMIADELQIGETSDFDGGFRNEKDLCQNCSLLSKSCEENNVALTGKP
jgi:hypothetical protein